jgi:hypothetical protein
VGEEISWLLELRVRILYVIIPKDEIFLKPQTPTAECDQPMGWWSFLSIIGAE